MLGELVFKRVNLLLPSLDGHELTWCNNNKRTRPLLLFYGFATMDHPQDQVQHHSLSDPETFWGHQAEHLHWHKKPSVVLARATKDLKSGDSHDHWEWFPDGEISTCYNCVDRHVLAGRGDAPAILYDSPVTKTKQRFTYKQLLDEVEVFAAVLREEGVKKGDVVLVYSMSIL